MTDTPMHRLTEFAGPSKDELALFKSLCGPDRLVQRHDVIRAHGDPVRHIYLLSSGWVTSCLDLRNGDRQIVKIHVPGDVLGAPSLSLETAAETLIAITPGIVRPMPLAAIGQIFTEAPRLAASLFVSAQQERIFLMERLTSIGRMPAINRLVVLLLHVHDRLVHIGGPEGQIDWPLTQTEIGDVLGLTAVHVNRMLKALDREGMTKRAGSTIRLNDIPALRRLSGLPERRWVNRPDWLAGIAI